MILSLLFFSSKNRTTHRNQSMNKKFSSCVLLEKMVKFAYNMHAACGNELRKSSCFHTLLNFMNRRKNNETGNGSMPLPDTSLFDKRTI